jgi:hypothetical protein
LTLDPLEDEGVKMQSVAEPVFSKSLPSIPKTVSENVIE